MINCVDIHRIEEQHRCLQECFDVLKSVDSLFSSISFFAASRALHVAIECITDVGSLLIDGLMMRDPGSYVDIIVILEGEAVLSAKIATELKELVRFRENLVRGYTELGSKDVVPFLEKIWIFPQFIQEVHAYLVKEGIQGVCR